MRYLFIFLLLYTSNFAIGQTYTFNINVKVEGKFGVKNALFYNNENKLLKKVEISDHQFNFSGDYDLNSKSVQWPLCKLILSDQDSVDSKTIELKARIIFYEPNVFVTYNSTNLSFVVTGGEENALKNIFENNMARYKRRVDTMFTSIEKSADRYELKNEKKRDYRVKIFMQMQKDNLKVIQSNSNLNAAMHEFRVHILMGWVSFNDANLIFSSFPAEMKNTGYGRRIEQLINRMKSQSKSVSPKSPKLGLNETMYDFVLNDINDIPRNAKELYGTYTLIDFWASWCNPCRNESPNLKRAFEAYRKKGFNIIAISIDAKQNKEKWKAAVEVDQMQEFTNLFNPNASSGIGKDLNINAIPANYLVDKNGKILAINLRGEELLTFLRRLYTR